jgi:3-methyladenine DNA glycosylase/8-oxoguanine DNA glycosylase
MKFLFRDILIRIYSSALLETLKNVPSIRSQMWQAMIHYIVSNSVSISKITNYCAKLRKHCGPSLHHAITTILPYLMSAWGV